MWRLGRGKNEIKVEIETLIYRCQSIYALESSFFLSIFATYGYTPHTVTCFSPCLSIPLPNCMIPRCRIYSFAVHAKQSNKHIVHPINAEDANPIEYNTVRTVRSTRYIMSSCNKWINRSGWTENKYHTQAHFQLNNTKHVVQPEIKLYREVNSSSHWIEPRHFSRCWVLRIYSIISGPQRKTQAYAKRSGKYLASKLTQIIFGLQCNN
jgi:hypothetical protein